MAEYYYLLSSLPSLDFQVGPPLSYPELMDRSIPWLSQHDLVHFQSARIDIESVPEGRIRHPLVRCWCTFEHSLRHELVKIRAERIGVPAEPYLREHVHKEAITVPFLRQLVEDPSPLKVELALLEARWLFLTDHELDHYFDLTALMIYSLKLQILERKGKFEAGMGRQILESGLADMLHKATSFVSKTQGVGDESKRSDENILHGTE